MNRDEPLTHALSFDIEDWFHMVDIDAVSDPNGWSKLPTIVERYTETILRICEEHGVFATFFVLGWVADRYPGLVSRIRDGGHEIGAHSFWHKRVYEQSKAELASELRASIDVLEQHSGVHVTGFRAPSFSITEGAEWAFDVIVEAGFSYDASLFPAPRAHGGYACTLGAHMITTPSGSRLPELPMSTTRLGIGRAAMPVCYSGGGYLRLLPIEIIERGMAQEARAGRPTVVYLHPRDFAPDCPRVAMPLHRRFKSYVGAKTTEPKLRHLLSRHAFAPCGKVLGSLASEN